MRRNLAVEQIYDAAFNDEALRALAVDLGTHLGARSALIHWIHADGSAEVLAHSGYFTDEQLYLYARDFAAIDPWVHATAAPECANRVHDLEDFVPSAVFAASDFYNDYVRTMGDDTGRCLGVRLQSNHGSGFIALQRGLGQRGFDPMAVRRLQHYSAHLMRMLALRGRLISAQRRSDELAAAIDGFGRPALLVESTLRLRHANHSAELMLQSGNLVSTREGALRIAGKSATEQLHRAVEKVLTTGEATAISIRNDTDGQIELSVTAVASRSGPRLALILLSGAIETDASRSSRLRALYGLSAGEACVAGMLADGMSPAEIAETRRVAIGTVRFQIKQIALKLGCHRQTDIVRAVCSLPPLHCSDSDWR